MKNVSPLSNELGKKSFTHFTFLLEILYWNVRLCEMCRNGAKGLNNMPVIY